MEENTRHSKISVCWSSGQTKEYKKSWFNKKCERALSQRKKIQKPIPIMTLFIKKIK